MTAHNDGSRIGEVFGELVLIALVLYFAWRAGPMADYVQRLVPYFVADNKDTISHVMGYLYYYARPAIVFLTLALPAAAFMSLKTEDESLGGGLAFLLIVWAALGWWIGRSFEKALAAKILCKQSSTFGFGCTLNGPIFSHLIFSALTLLIAVLAGMFLIGALFGGSTGSDEESN